MNRLRSSFLALLFSVAGISCTLRLPDATDMDRYYEVAQSQCKDRVAELERRRASGELDEAGYKREKTRLDNYIADRAATLAWTAHDLREKDRAVVGIPTPSHPQKIDVPQAGSLPTGSEFRRFNQNEMGSAVGSSSIGAMQELIGGSANTNQIAAPTKTAAEAEQPQQ